jgi:hypothetical protein
LNQEAQLFHGFAKPIEMMRFFDSVQIRIFVDFSTKQEVVKSKGDLILESASLRVFVPVHGGWHR